MSQKRILILGGASVHCKLVSAAKELGLYTIVTDYLENSPAKLLADKSYMYDVNDVDSIVNMCIEENVDAVISSHLDPCQRPYQKICERLNLPCFGTEEQFFKLTDKHAFKQMCLQNNVQVVDEYSKEDIINGKATYPVFIKPVDSRGSRGQSVCRNIEEAKKAIAFAEKESSNGDILIEKYMENCDEVQITYFLIDGKAHLIRTVDSHRGSADMGLDKVVLCSISPSKYTDVYLKTAHENVVNMFHQLGLKNGPVFMQGFYHNQNFHFFDPGLRFPGVDYEKIYQEIYNVDLLKYVIFYALNEKEKIKELPSDSVYIKNKRAAILFPTISAGTIASIQGVDELLADPRIKALHLRHSCGDHIHWTRDINQRIAEIDILCDNIEETKNMIQKIWGTLSICDSNLSEMLIPFYNFETFLKDTEYTAGD